MTCSSYALNPAFYPDKLTFAPIPFYPAVPMPLSKALIHADMYAPLLELYRAGLREGLELYGISAYRSYYRQLSIYNLSIMEKGYEHTKKYIAYPGTSEHHTGFAIDLSCPSINFELDASFAQTREGIWLNLHAADYGFHLSYPGPAGNTAREITAREITAREITAREIAAREIAAWENTAQKIAAQKSHDSIEYEPWHICYDGFSSRQIQIGAPESNTPH